MQGGAQESEGRVWTQLGRGEEAAAVCKLHRQRAIKVRAEAVGLAPAEQFGIELGGGTLNWTADMGDPAGAGTGGGITAVGQCDGWARAPPRHGSSWNLSQTPLSAGSPGRGSSQKIPPRSTRP